MIEAASPATIVYGTQDTLSVTGMPGDATGTVTFFSGSTTCALAILPARAARAHRRPFPRCVPGDRDVLR